METGKRTKVLAAGTMNAAGAESFLGLEIGGTKLQLVLGDARGSIENRWRATVEREQGAAGIRLQIQNLLAASLAHSPRVASLGVGFGGPVDWQGGAIACSHQIEGWSGFGLAEWLRQRVRVPVFVDNDANVAALGEAERGAGQGANPVFYVTLGSGVGGGLVVDGHIYHGAQPGESEIGHVRLNPAGDTVESRCSGWAVDRRLQRHRASAPLSRLSALMAPFTGGESRCLAGALSENNPDAWSILKETVDDLTFGMSHVVHLVHPEVIVLGGGLALVGEPLRALVEKSLGNFIMEVFRPGPAIKLAALGEDAVPTGALILAGRAR
jgi:glucokinase